MSLTRGACTCQAPGRALPDSVVAAVRDGRVPSRTERASIVAPATADLLAKASPLLIHGAFTRAMPMGCLASHVAWNHPLTCKLQQEAGAVWLTKVAGLNPATSAVILAWDRDGHANFDLRTQLLAACNEELSRRAARVEELEPAAC